MALVNEFWRPEKDDYRSMVQQCLMHPTPAGVKNGDGCSFISLAQRKGTKETSTLTKASLYGEDAIDYGQKPPCVKVLVRFTKLSP